MDSDEHELHGTEFRAQFPERLTPVADYRSEEPRGLPPERFSGPRQRLKLAVFLFFLTCWSTFEAQGFVYSVAVMSFLLAHEMGHYVQSRRYGVPASFPYFIPMTFSPLGTMGAVIVQQGGVADRKALFDIAISGPLAGLVLALPLACYGIAHATIVDLPRNQEVFLFGDPLLFKWLTTLWHGPLKPGQELALNPILFAGWVGIFITALNLIPIGQLDGGHILYTLVRKKAHVIARLLLAFAALTVVYGGLFIQDAYFSWTLMLALVWFMGPKHPPTANDYVPLGTARIILGWLTLSFVIVGFIPTPMYVTRIDQAPPVQPAPVVQPPAPGVPILTTSLPAVDSGRYTSQR